MKLFQQGSTVLLALAVVTAPSWAAINGNPCEANIGTGGGCGTPVGIQNAGALTGGQDMTGSQYAGKCAGIGVGCTILQPPLRFWEQDNFFAHNSGNATQDDATSGNFWMINPNLDFGQATPNTQWMIFQANWANTGVKSCISATRNVCEVSFCDPGGVSKYMVMSVADPSISLFDFNLIVGANGASNNIVPLTDVPTPTGLSSPGTQNGTDATQMDFSVTIAAGSTKWWTDVAPGANDPANQLVRGIEIVYQNAAAAPAANCNTGLGVWLPVHNPATPAANLGPMPPGTFNVTVPKPVTPMQTWVAARVIYADSASTCSPAQPCLDPQTQNTPASCFNQVAGPVNPPGTVGAVTFSGMSAKREGGNVASIQWQTTMESNTVGFTVERSASQAGPWTALPGFIGAMGPGYPYKAVDHNATASQTFFYRIHETASAGQASISSPVRVGPASSAGGDRNRNLHN